MKNKPITLILADDHPVFRHGLRDVIEFDKRFHVLAEASDGVEALRLTLELKPDVLVLDLDMPNLNGIETARLVGQKKIPVNLIFLTMYKEEDMFNEAIEAGAKGYVLKESAVADILDSIECVAAGRHYISPGLSAFLVSRGSRAETLLKEKPGLAELTPAERRVLKLISENKTSKEIAEKLGLSTRTIENHRSNICTKLDIHGIHSLVRFAFDNRTRL